MAPDLKIANPYVLADAFAAEFRQTEYALKRSGFLRKGKKGVICPLQGGPKSMLFWTLKGRMDAIEEAQCRGDYRQAA